MRAHPPEILTPDKLPDPWLFTSESLLHELTRIRHLAQLIPLPRNEFIGPINTVINAVWDLEQRLQYILQLQAQAQSAFRTRSQVALPKHQKPHSHGQPRARRAIARVSA